MDNPSQSELREKMRQLRDLGGYSQKDFANAMDITQSSYFRLENGEIKTGFKHIAGCADLLEVSFTDFLRLPAEELAERIRRKPPPPPESERVNSGGQWQ